MRLSLTTPLFALLAGVLVGCQPEPDEPGSRAGAGDRQSAFRVRSGAGLPLSAEAGWAADVNQSTRVVADRPFRLRLEVEHGGAERERRYRFQVRRNEGDWQPLPAENFPRPAKELELNFERRPSAPPSEQWQLLQGSAGALSWQPEGEETGKGYLRLDAEEGPLLALARYHTPWQPVEFAADLRLPEAATGRVGLIFGYRDADNHHRVELEKGRGLSLIEVRNGEAQTLTRAEHPVTAGRWAELKIVLRGPEVTIEYDDEALVFSERLDEPVEPRLGVFVARGGALELPALAVEGLPRSPRVSIIEARAFEHGEATGDLLPVSGRELVAGAGVSFAEHTPVFTAAGGQSEWEFPLVIRRFSDGAARNDSGDRFEFRLVDAEGTVLPAASPAAVTLEVPAGHLGGTFVETPMRIGPWQAETGALYFLMEPAETDNMLMTVKSEDGGASWVEVDGANRPATGDLEGFASTFVGDRIHMLHQTSDHVFYHVFRTADHPERPDTWAIRDERLASPEEPPTQVADIAVRSDGSVVAVYGGPDKIHYRVRSPEGRWSEETIVDADRGPNLSGPTLLKTSDDRVHLAYTGDDGSAWYRQLRPDGTLTPRRQLASGLGTGSEDIGSILPLVALPKLNKVSAIYRLGNGELWERRIGAGGEFSDPVRVSDTSVVQNAVDSDQTGADVVAHGGRLHLLFVAQGTDKLMYTYRGENGDWSRPRVQVGDAEVQWVRGAVIKTPEGKTVYGCVYDAGSDGGSGMNRYAELPLSD